MTEDDTFTRLKRWTYEDTLLVWTEGITSFTTSDGTTSFTTSGTYKDFERRMALTGWTINEFRKEKKRRWQNQRNDV